MSAMPGQGEASAPGPAQQPPEADATEAVEELIAARSGTLQMRSDMGSARVLVQRLRHLPEEVCADLGCSANSSCSV